MSEMATLPTLGKSTQGAIVTEEGLSDISGARAVIDEKEALRRSTSEVDSADEKGGYDGSSIAEAVDADTVEAVALVNDGRPFPVDPLAPVEEHQLTVRALVVGSLLGLIVGASNIYLGLKTGFTFGATLFGSILGFAILKPLSTAVPKRFGGGYFGPKETVVIQSTAGAAGGMSGLFVAAVPAMYQLNLLSTNAADDIKALIALSFLTAYFGLFFAMPLRKYYILRQKLVFPSPTVTAFTIRSLHATANAASRAASWKKILILLYSFSASTTFTVLSKYAPGVLWDWNIGWFLWTWGAKNAIRLQNWGWIYEFTPAFHAVGFLTGLNPALSWLGGAVLAWGIIGPAMVSTGKAYSPEFDPENFPGWRNNFSLGTVIVKGVVDPSRGTARYQLLWVGVLIMLCTSFVELGMQGPMLYRAFRGVVNEGRVTLLRRLGKDTSHIKDRVPEGDPDPAPANEQVATLSWALGIAVSVSLSMILAKTEFNLNPGVTLLSLILGFIFAFVGVQASGTTDVNPVGVIAKAGQLIIGGVTKGTGVDIAHAQLTNLVAGSIVGQSASHSVDMVGDLKTGHLIGAAPNAQFWAQLVGSTVGFAFAPGLFVLFAKAYPCITDITAETCPFGLPAVSAWRAVAIAVTADKLPITLASGMTAIGLAIAASLTVVAKHTIIPVKYRPYVPNWNAIGLAFVVPQVQYAITAAVGAIIAYLWEKKRPASWEIWGFSLAAGLVAGEGIGGVILALFTIVGIDGSKYGSAVGCPGYEYCG